MNLMAMNQLSQSLLGWQFQAAGILHCGSAPDLAVAGISLRDGINAHLNVADELTRDQLTPFDLGPVAPEDSKHLFIEHFFQRDGDAELDVEEYELHSGISPLRQRHWYMSRTVLGGSALRIENFNAYLSLFKNNGSAQLQVWQEQHGNYFFHRDEMKTRVQHQLGLTLTMPPRRLLEGMQQVFGVRPSLLDYLLALGQEIYASAPEAYPYGFALSDKGQQYLQLKPVHPMPRGQWDRLTVLPASALAGDGLEFSELFFKEDRPHNESGVVTLQYDNLSPRQSVGSLFRVTCDYTGQQAPRWMQQLLAGALQMMDGGKIV